MSLFRQGSQFTLIGALQLAVDCGIFIAGTAAGLPAVPANLLGRIGGRPWASGSTAASPLPGRMAHAWAGSASAALR